MIFESHAHLLAKQFDHDRDEVIKRALENGIHAVLNVSDDMKSSKESVIFANTHERIFSSVGIHPHNGKGFKEEDLDLLETLALDSKTLAIGEIGLDYYYDFCEKEVQKEIFAKQLELAKNMGLPVIIHDREAHKDTIDILSSFNKEIKGVMHCYSGSAESAKILLNLGLYISFTGVITFKNANKTIEALKAIPLDRLLLETDCPYMSPEPLRGTRNEPKNLIYTARKIAEVKQVQYDILLEQLWENSFNLFEKARRYKQELESR
ncbi:MAG TPA: TatD family hydrolase [Clostridia bacterium]|nr:MAG: putative deoxyribonuclease YcfH [Firmicutes bacterium ADurb.Bin146]HOD93119.1 TatD family hydrolase [Clostridia bacterium]HQM39084.1 TatD family hydrolase [Clostridia bacterium]